MKPHKPAVIAVIGSKGSGKTTLIETLTRELTSRGYRVAAVKHIPEETFTIDMENRDTWRYAMAGAKTVIAVSPKEMAIIEKTDTSILTLKDILKKCLGNDVVIIECFRKLLGVNMNVPKIVTVKSAEEAAEAVKTFRPIIAFAGFHQIDEIQLNVPYVNLSKDGGELMDLIEDYVIKRGRV